jgi:hypothetical protein
MTPSIDNPDALTLAELRKAGSDLSKPHLIEFFLYFPNRDSAEEVAEILRTEGYELTVSLGADNVNWLCFATKPLTPSQKTLAAIRDHFEALVISRSGEYDGWGTAIVK